MNSNNRAIITFSNNEELIVCEGDMFIPVKLTEHKGEPFTSQTASYEVWNHTHVGLIPSLTEMISSSSFFSKIENQDVIYASSAVVKIANI